jgi:hypothetical protein
MLTACQRRPKTRLKGVLSTAFGFWFLVSWVAGVVLFLFFFSPCFYNVMCYKIGSRQKKEICAAC